jgi:hypothetical protein
LSTDRYEYEGSKTDEPNVAKRFLLIISFIKARELCKIDSKIIIRRQESLSFYKPGI